MLKDTYGVIVYQEQVMQISQVLGGYSLGRADLLRRAMGKKKAEVMQAERAGFLEGCQAKGIDPKVAGEIFDLMEKFAEYGFNKSHSAAYGLITLQTAWLKAHHPTEFMAALLTSEKDNTDKVVAHEVQGLLNSVTNVIECATGGHGRCVDSACRCHCHKPRVPVPFKQQMSF